MRTSHRLLSQLRHHYNHHRSSAAAAASIDIFIGPFRPENEPEVEQYSKVNEVIGVRNNEYLGLSQNPIKGLFGSRNVGFCSSRLGFYGGGNHKYHQFGITRGLLTRAKKIEAIQVEDHSQRAVTTALWCNFLVFSLKFGVWLVSSSHVMLAEVVHSVADFANQALLAYGLSSSKRAPDAIHPYGYSKERFVWSLISAVGIFCLGSGATIVHGIQNLWSAQSPENMQYAALVIGGSLLIEGVSLYVAINAVRKGAASEGLSVRDYIWRGHDPTAVAVMTEDGAAVAGLLIAGASLIAVNATGNPIYDPIGSIIVGNLLGMVAVFLIQRNRHALIGRAIDDKDTERVLQFLKNDPVVDSVYDSKSEVIGPGFFRFKAEIDFNGVVLVQNHLSRTGREHWAKQFRDAAKEKDDAALVKLMSIYGEEVVTALGSEVDRLEQEIQDIVPGIRHVDIEAHNPIIEAHNPIVPSP